MLTKVANLFSFGQTFQERSCLLISFLGLLVKPQQHQLRVINSHVSWSSHFLGPTSPVELIKSCSEAAIFPRPNLILLFCSLPFGAPNIAQHLQLSKSPSPRNSHHRIIDTFNKTISIHQKRSNHHLQLNSNCDQQIKYVSFQRKNLHLHQLTSQNSATKAPRWAR